MPAAHESRHRRSLACATALAVAAAFVAQPAAADVPTATPEVTQPTAAEKLFYEARKLAAEGKYSEACPMFAESERLAPGIGTLFNLSDCYEHMGRTKTAWKGYREVARKATDAGQAERQRIATERADVLEPRLSRLLVKLPHAKGATLEVKREGELLSDAFVDAVPVDPGTFTLVVSAPGKRSWQTDIRVSDPGTMAVTVPELANSEDDRGTPPTRALAIATVAVGVVGLGFGSFFALRAMSKNSDSKAQCDPNAPDICNQQGVDLRDEARFAGDVATVSFTVGIVALAAGTVLWFGTPSLHVGSRAVPGGGTVVVGSAW